MKCIYEASSGLEAHMILNLLQNNDIEGRIDGEYLQGGAGELQAMNMVRVLVNEADYTKARSIVTDWDTTQVETTKAPASSKNSPGIITGLLSGLIIGAGITILAYHTPITTDGIDHDGDGNLDEKWIYRSNRISKVETDRNRDGEIDSISFFNRKGAISRIEMDENFDGVNETTVIYDRYGNPFKTKADTNNDGHVDYITLFKDGVFYEAQIIDPTTNKPRKIQTFEINKLISSRYDSDGDGILETVKEYDHYEEARQ
ncbi:MAG: DUF2007 domain-containing protein [Gammaproteobacteria bacterium]|nr:DUF2007 domain-containing protein [Gammaproteobacteria bacterium]